MFKNFEKVSLLFAFFGIHTGWWLTSFFLFLLLFGTVFVIVRAVAFLFVVSIAVIIIVVIVIIDLYNAEVVLEG